MLVRDHLYVHARLTELIEQGVETVEEQAAVLCEPQHPQRFGPRGSPIHIRFRLAHAPAFPLDALDEPELFRLRFQGQETSGVAFAQAPFLRRRADRRGQLQQPELVGEEGGALADPSAKLLPAETVDRQQPMAIRALFSGLTCSTMQGTSLRPSS